MRGPRSVLRAAVVKVVRSAAGGALLLAALVAGGTPAARAGDETSAAALAARNESLRRELELAQGDEFYLLLDPTASVLTLLYKGAALRETPVVTVEVGEPRARGVDAERSPVELDGIWSKGTLVPPRVDVREEVVPPPVEADVEEGHSDGSSGAAQGEFLDGDEPGEGEAEAEPAVEEVEIPKTPEELYPVPPSYEIRFQEGLTIEVARAQDDEAEGVEPAAEPGVFERLARLARRLSLLRPPGERVRLRLVIASDDADRLFRSLPPDVKFLMLRSVEDL